MDKFFFLLIFVLSQGYSQSLPVNTLKASSNPIVFLEGYGGIGGGEDLITVYGLQANFQFFEKDLVTFRLTHYENLKSDPVLFGFAAFPLFVKKNTLDEFGLLYGKRYIFRNSSFSFSGGGSLNEEVYYSYNQEIKGYEQHKTQKIGFPFEFNIKWFKPRKSRFRAYYGLVPIGKREVAFGRSFGFKIIGNVSTRTYVGLGISYGFGFHKKY